MSVTETKPLVTETKTLTFEDRNRIYTEVATALMNMLIYEGCDDVSFWTLNDPNMKRFKVMLKLFRDHGKEFSGSVDIEFKSTGHTEIRKLIYELHNNPNRKSVAYFSKDKHKISNRIQRLPQEPSASNLIQE